MQIEIWMSIFVSKDRLNWKLIVFEEFLVENIMDVNRKITLVAAIDKDSTFVVEDVNGRDTCAYAARHCA